MVYGGRPGKKIDDNSKINKDNNQKNKIYSNNDTDMVVCSERAAMLAERVKKIVSLRKTKISDSEMFTLKL